ncbi:phage holin family protein [Adhaeretor mobilis]|uniref:Uncharacterized protein n=1 Tax=Adhaeretor mobilis TaxID=1930276 RepID=A0A517N0V6_9BACT|nr:phage holin family protein [Adhaeretor mobilis]QDT00769.1 hypothetical protein HG15A2_41100 [Adhaeretor mobilis]
MPTVASPPSADEQSRVSLPAQHQEFIDKQVQKTRRGLKIVDLTAGLITLVIGVLLFLLTAAIIDHWIVPGGLGTIGRSLLFGGFLAGIAWHVWRSFLPLLRPINPIYAAQTIETNSPSLKNNLLNLLLFRGRKQPMAAQVYQAIQKQTADRLSESPMASVIDRSAVIKLGYALVAVVALCALYRVFSPKDPTATMGRVLAPWADIAAPSRVKINDISPGDASVARGERLDISAAILGMADNEPVELHYSSLDQQIVDSRLLMNRQGETDYYAVTLPPKRGGVSGRVTANGIGQDLKYWITAGDARSLEHRITVYSRPTIVVTGVRYEYPSYTGYPTQTSTDTGDVRAVEGTRVTLSAVSNLPLKSAHIDFAADGRRDLSMKVDGDRATATFTLKLQQDRRTPQHKSYALRMVTTSDRQNVDPAKYTIEVTPDYAPEIRILSPEEPEIEVRSDETVRIEVEARDPDFAVQQVELVGLEGEREIALGRLLEEDFPGKFNGGLPFTPEEAGLQPGDVLEYWATAHDNRRPEANLGVSAHRRMKIVGPAERPNIPDQEQQPNVNQEGGQGEQGEGGGEAGEAGQQGGGGEGGEAGENDPNAEGEGQPGEGGEGDNQDAQAGEGGQGGEGGGQNPDQQNAMNDQGTNQENGQGGGQQNQQGDSQDPQQQNQPNDAGDNGQQDQQPGDQQNQPQGGQPDGKGQQGGEQQDPVASDGSDDGEAFDRIAEHLEEQNGEASPQQENGNSAEQNDDPKAQQTPGEQSQTGDSQNNQPQEEGEAGEGAQPEEGGENQPAQPQGNQTGEAQEAPGEGGNQPDAAQPKPEGEGEQQQGEGSEGPDSNPNRNQGESGGGENPGEEQGTPQANPKKPEEKDGESQGHEADSEEPAESKDKKESDTEGGQSGDRSGEGQEGAGQQADDEGKGGAGQNTAAEEGANAANEPGEGETGQKPGDGAPADGETGESSEDQSGDGSEQEDGQGDQPGGEAGEGEQPEAGEVQDPQASQGESGKADPSQQPGDKDSQQEQGESTEPSKGDSGQTGQPNGQPSGASAGEGSDHGDTPPDGEIEAGDKANLDYANKQTDLVLEKLEDQLAKKDVDKDLLDKLGWDQQELRKFVDRWKNLKDRAEGNGEDAGEAETQLNQALRSLGLKGNGPRRFKSSVDKDKLRDLNEAYRNQAPLKYRDRVRAYVKGAASEK